jgi:sialate O-acetylesterase
MNITEIPAAPKAWDDPNKPTILYNAMINPIVPFTIRGAIWYQGEGNADKAYQYRELFPLMIKDWRKQWNYNFPFYFVQLANYTTVLPQPAEASWAELREAQLQTLHLENTGMAVIIDRGEVKSIHPKDKQEVGRRLSLIARANAYGEKIPFSGPVYDSYKIEGNSIRIKFQHTDGGLKINKDEILKGFEIAGPDHQFYWASATIDGNDVLVSCRNIENPIAVRFAWAANPVCNLFNGADLPASPFRTDDWQGITYNRK